MPGLKLFKLFLRAIVLTTVAASTHAQEAEEATEEAVAPIQSDWLELVKGYKGATLGAELREIEDDEDGRTVTLAIPKESIEHPDEIEEVVVVGRKPDKPEPLQIDYEWLDDYENDNYGLVIRLGKDSRWPIRLYLNSDPGFTRNSEPGQMR
jgi:hypothetical protein